MDPGPRSVLWIQVTVVIRADDFLGQRSVTCFRRRQSLKTSVLTKSEALCFHLNTT